MAFQLGTVDFIVKTLLPRIEHRGRVLSLARQRITCPVTDLIEYLESEGFSPDREQMAELSPATSKELFESFGFDQYEDLDFTPEEGVTIVHDMNEPISQAYHDRYDLIFEMGTMEHIFDVKSTFDNIIKMLKVGGTIFHLAPLNFLNHGFYNLSPTLFYDVYRKNGFRDFEFYLVEFPEKWWKNPHTGYRKFDFTPDPIKPKIPKGYFLMVCFMATKDHALEEFQVPIQAFYDPDLNFQSS